MAKRKATPSVVKQEPNEPTRPLHEGYAEPGQPTQSFPEVYAEPKRFFYDRSGPPHAHPGTWQMEADPALSPWNSTTLPPNRLWPIHHPALHNIFFAVIPTNAADRTTIEIPASSVLRPIFKRERMHMDEAYMLLEHVIQQGSPMNVLENIQFQFAHCLRNEFFLVTDSDSVKGSKNDSFGLHEAIWNKEEDVLHRRRYLELSFHALSSGTIMFPTDVPPHRKYSLQSVLDMKNSDEVRLKLMEIPCDDPEPRYAFRSLRRNDLIGTGTGYVLLNATYRHPDQFDGKIKPYVI